MSREESFSPNPGRCHCHGVRWPITHGTWTDGEGKQSLILLCIIPLSHLPSRSLYSGNRSNVKQSRNYSEEASAMDRKQPP